MNTTAHTATPVVRGLATITFTHADGTTTAFSATDVTADLAQMTLMDIYAGKINRKATRWARPGRRYATELSYR
jgi:hypothetical protein